MLSFAYLAIYWDNHHHLLYATWVAGGGVLWANMHLLFWLPLVPFTTGWMDPGALAGRPSSIPYTQSVPAVSTFV